MSEIKYHILTRVNDWKNIKIRNCTFFCGSRQKSKYNYFNIKTAHPVSATFFSNCLSFDCFCSVFHVTNWTESRVAFFFSFKSRHLKLYCKIIQLSLFKYFSRVMVKRSILQLIEQLFFLHSCDGCFQSKNQKIGRWKSINKTSSPEEKLKQLGKWSFCHVSSNGWSV